MEKDLTKIANSYFDNRIMEYGACAKGVDWKDESSQELRYRLLTLNLPQQDFSVLDYGCGYGYGYQYLLKNKFTGFRYTGLDVSQNMLDTATDFTASLSKDPDQPAAEFLLGSKVELDYDYIVSSGVFNVKNETQKSEWEEYVQGILCNINQQSVKGFAFNLLTSYSDPEFRKDYLYYADPCYWFDFCKRNFSKQVALYHDYPLYEFTIFVRKEI